jgi:ABC-2 type transport system permease protein
MANFIDTQLRRMRASKKVRYGGYAILTSLGLIAALVLINLIVDQLQVQVDLTESRLFSLGEQTQKLLDDLDNDITIYQIAPAGRENPLYDTVLQRYARRSTFVALATLDAERNPGLARRYEEDGQLRTGSIVVDGAERFRLISQTDLIDFSSRQGGGASSLKIEQAVTSAILFVTTGQVPTLYTLEGHSEIPLFQLGVQGVINLREMLEQDNYQVESLDLIAQAGVPEAADVVAILEPQQDLSSDELAKLGAYLGGGGRALFAFQGPVTRRLPNFDELLSRYGVRVGAGMVFGAPAEAASGNPMWLLPEPTAHPITSPLRTERRPAVMPQAAPIEILEQRRRSLDIEPLLNTSSASFLRTDFDINSFEQQAGERNGPFVQGVAVQDNDLDGRLNSRIVVFSSASFFMTFPAEQNYDLVLNAINWVNEREDAISIRAKSLLVFPLRINRVGALVIAGVAVLLLPLLALGTGTVVWLRRRHL